MNKLLRKEIKLNEMGPLGHYGTGYFTMCINITGILHFNVTFVGFRVLNYHYFYFFIASKLIIHFLKVEFIETINILQFKNQ